MNFPVRINKYIADQGWTSRREADVLIESGKIVVNGKTAKIGQKIDAKDRVELKGKTKDRVYLAYYKGRGIITHSPDKTQAEVDILSKLSSTRSDLVAEVYPVGRLDKDSEGLIILTNDGRVTGPLLDPESSVEKEYEVRVDKPIKSQFIKSLKNGVNIEGYQTKKPTAVSQVGQNPDGKKFTITLTEGKKHQIRRMCAALGYQVTDLKRTRILNVKLAKLKPNQFRTLKGKELSEFLKALSVK